jgi:hypothetical protein
MPWPATAGSEVNRPAGAVAGDRLGAEGRDQGGQDDEREVSEERAGRTRDRDAQDPRRVTSSSNVRRQIGDGRSAIHLRWAVWAV